MIKQKIIQLFLLNLLILTVVLQEQTDENIWENSHIKDINPNNHTGLENLFKSESKFFLEVYSKTCGHCKILAPELDVIAEHYTSTYNLPFYRLEGLNIGRKLGPLLRISGFPNLFLIDNGRIFKFISRASPKYIVNFLDSTANFSCKNLDKMDIPSLENLKSILIEENPFLIGYFSNSNLFSLFNQFLKTKRQFIKQCFYFTEELNFIDFLKKSEKLKGFNLKSASENFIISYNSLAKINVFEDFNTFDSLKLNENDNEEIISLSEEEQSEYFNNNIKNTYTLNYLQDTRDSSVDDIKINKLKIHDYYINDLQIKFNKFIFQFHYPKYNLFNSEFGYINFSRGIDYLVFSFITNEQKEAHIDSINKYNFLSKNKRNLEIILFDSTIEDSAFYSIPINNYNGVLIISSDFKKSEEIIIENRISLEKLFHFIEDFYAEKENQPKLEKTEESESSSKAKTISPMIVDNLTKEIDKLRENEFLNEYKEPEREAEEIMLKHSSIAARDVELPNVLKELKTKPPTAPSVPEKHENEITYKNETKLRDDHLTIDDVIIYSLYLLIYSLFFYFFYSKLSQTQNVIKIN